MFRQSFPMTSLEKELMEIRENHQIEMKYRRLRELEAFAQEEEQFFQAILSLPISNFGKKRNILAEAVKFDRILLDIIHVMDMDRSLSIYTKLLTSTKTFLKSISSHQNPASVEEAKTNFVRSIDAITHQLSIDYAEKVKSVFMTFVGGVIAFLTVGWVTSIADNSQGFYNRSRTLNQFKLTLLDAQKQIEVKSLK